MTDLASASASNPSVARRIAVAGLLVQIGLGSAYGWSVLRGELAAAFDASIPSVTLTFSLFILCAGFASVVGGLWAQRWGPRRVAVASGVLYGGGLVLAGRSGDALWQLYVSYGMVGGIGMGLGYIVPIATLQRWFPHRRGLINGVAVSGIPAGALIAAPLAGWLVDEIGVLDALVVLGLGYGLLVTLAGLALRDPPAGPADNSAKGAEDRDSTLRDALRSPRWYVLWATFFLSVTAGVGLISEAAPMAEEIGGVGALAAAGITGALFVGDALGRLWWPWSSDIVGRPWVLAAIFVLQALAFATMSLAGSYVAFALIASFILFNYGGSSGTMAPFVSDLFGARHVGSIYGLMLTAWGLGGVAGPLLIAAIHDATGGYDLALLVIAMVMAASVLLPLSLRGARRT